MLSEIPVEQFEQYIDESILDRGLSYFSNGHVEEVKTTTPGTTLFQVEGSQPYRVMLKIDGKVLVEHHCTCPYDYGPICKHEVACLFHIQAEELELDVKPKKQAAKPRKKPKTMAQKVDALLNAVSHQELKAFVKAHTVHDRVFRDGLLAAFVHLQEDISKATYTKQVKAILRSASGRGGFIHRSDTRAVSLILEQMLDKAEELQGDGCQAHTIWICTAIIEEVSNVLYSSDDSEGDLSGCIDLAFEQLSMMAPYLSNPDLRLMLFNYCIEAFEKGKFSDWDWHIGMLDIAEDLAEDPKEIQVVYDLLDGVTDDWNREIAQDRLYHLLLRQGKKDEAESFLQKYMANPRLKRQALQKAVENEEFAYAKQLAKQGVVQDEDHKPGLVLEWHDWLLKIAQLEQNQEEILNLSRHAFIQHYVDPTDYYQIMKGQVAKKDWPNYVEQLLATLTQSSHWRHKSLMMQIYIQEHYWDRLMEQVRKDPDLREIERYEKYLANDYGPELVEFYAKGIKEYLAQNTGRGYYKTACQYLKHMAGIGGGKQAQELAETLRKTYPKRKALLEELEGY